MELFNKFKMKFLLIPLILIGSLLLITFITIFSITYSSTTNDVETALEEGARTQSGKFIYIKVTKYPGGGELVESYNFPYDKEEIPEIRSYLNSDEGKFTYKGRRYAYVLHHPQIDPLSDTVYTYTILDWTEQRNTVLTLGITLLGVFLISLVIL